MPANRFSQDKDINSTAELLYEAGIGDCISEGGIGLSIDNFAYHIGLIMSEPAPAKFNLWYGGENRARIEIRAGSLSGSEGSVWDQVFIDGVSCGNRCGGRQVYTALATPFISPTVNRVPGKEGEISQSTLVTFRSAAEAVHRAREEAEAGRCQAR